MWSDGTLFPHLHKAETVSRNIGMPLKKLLRLIEIFDTLFYIGVFLTIVAIILIIAKGEFYSLLIFVGLGTLLFKSLRTYLFRTALNNTQYPDTLISVVNQIGIDSIENTFNENFSFYEDLPFDYTTDKFLTDNKLNTEIGRRKWQYELKILLFVIATLLFLFLLRTIDFHLAMPAFIVSAILLLFLFWQFVIKRQNKEETSPLATFSKAGLHLEGKLIGWNSIQSWEFFRGWRYSPGYIEIKHGKTELAKDYIMLNKVNSSYIDILILLYHFKKLYGK